MCLIFIPILIWGDAYYIFFALCGILTVLASYEFRKMLKTQGRGHIFTDVLTIALTAIMYAALFFALLDNDYLVLPAVLLLFMTLLFLVVYLFMEPMDSKSLAEMFLTVLYVASGFASLAYLRFASGTLWLVTYVLLTAILTDTFAYLVGSKFGRHRLAEKISPKKSIEGAVAGLLAGGFLSALFAYFLDVFTVSFWIVLLISLSISIVAQFGDLVASKFKRNHSIKDFSNLIPGHGGIMDRFDSWIFSALFLTCLIRILAIFGVMVI